MWNRYSQITHQKNHTYHAQTNLYGQSYFYQLKEARPMKKLLLDSCTKTTFTFNGVIYEQRGGVCMGSSLSPLLANSIMTSLEEKVIKPLINDKTIKFYARHLICN